MCEKYPIRKYYVVCLFPNARHPSNSPRFSLDEAAVRIAIVPTAPEEEAETEDIYGQLQKAVEDAGGSAGDEVYTGIDLCYVVLKLCFIRPCLILSEC